ncbi:hypothetical protein AB1Y20_016068 [Prymnesium parvum]|uniref:Uncharacterized protein n=1 Tax=Prymnesium parvum TaxID=97485 RepID=A0AB34JZP4_PRYPA
MFTKRIVDETVRNPCRRVAAHPRRGAEGAPPSDPMQTGDALAAPPRRSRRVARRRGAACSELPFGLDVLRVIVALVDDLRQLRLVCRATRGVVEERLGACRLVARTVRLCVNWRIPARELERAWLMRAPVPLAVRHATLAGALAATTPLVDFGMTVTLALRCSPAELAEAATRAVAHAAGRAGAYELSYERCTSRDVEAIELPAMATSVGRGAFKGGRALRVVTFAEPSALATIAEGAFDSCERLQCVVVPKRVQTIGDLAFRGCTSLRDVTFEDGSILASIGGCAFRGCRAVLAVGLPGTLQKIGAEAFLDCSLLRAVTFAEQSALIDRNAGVLRLQRAAEHRTADWGAGARQVYVRRVHVARARDAADVAHDDMRGRVLVGVEFSASLETIGLHAFENCERLECAALPSSLRAIGACAFLGCCTLGCVTFATPSMLPVVDTAAFSMCALSSVAVPASVTAIRAHAFEMCTRLVSVHLATDGALARIGTRAFSQCTALRAVAFPPSLASIGERAFYACRGLCDVTFAEPGSLVAIDERAFDGCDALQAVTLPASLRWYARSAFGPRVAVSVS